ncbi:hypothetical protein [Brucella grignonensis]|uniref:Uncharacterized protein n=1 Tax=Brucella grignonensis TaxID=94627 RepID=A0A256FRN3_9HYPH|nr:hypothetical protein [Brucella grignonensis]NKB84058.1 hypothetical protein [Brucella grignonensis]OYR17504.1 hypothetical protein CEV33_3962 [Brucella grignonensis]
MVAWSNGQTSVICSIHEDQANDDEAPLKELARSCCSTLCQAACAFGVGLTAQALSFAYHAVFVARYLVVRLVVHGPPDFLAETYLPRGPPEFSADA